MAKAALTVKKILQEQQGKMTLAQILGKAPQLQSNEVSMALCYLMKMRYLTRELIANSTPKSRKQVWLYTYHANRLPKETT